MGSQERRPREWYEGRRLRAIQLHRRGWTQSRIAEALGVTKGAVSQWFETYRAEGRRALKARPRAGAPARLTNEQKNMIPEFLSYGAEAYGFRGEIWTCARIGKVIEREFNVIYHPRHVARIMDELGQSPQKPIVRATQRNEAEIARWRTETWPRLKKSRS